MATAVTLSLERLEADALRLQELIRQTNELNDEAQRLAWALDRDLEQLVGEEDVPKVLLTARSVAGEAIAENLAGNLHSGVAFEVALEDVEDLVDVVKLAIEQHRRRTFDA